MKKKIVPCFVAGKQKPYASCVVVGETIYISGMNGRSSETGEAVSNTIEGQTWRALEQINSAMRDAGSSLKNLVKITTFLKDMKDYQGYRDTEKKYFLEHAPELVKEPVASTVVQVASLPKPEFLIEIEAIGTL
ncbi:MAG: RidA family protein [Desulfobacterales bacterium]|nr:RidA family protein [Desulfobacterales bacterium]